MHGAERTHKWAQLVGRFCGLTVINHERRIQRDRQSTMEMSPMSYRMKITLPDPIMAHLEELATSNGEPVSRVAARMVCNEIAGLDGAGRGPVPAPELPATYDDDPDRRAPWIEPFMGDPEWKSQMWGSIVALHGRYPRELEHLKDGWWNDTAHVETLCALVVWRDWIDQAADDPRHELAFHAQLSDYSRELRQEGGGVTRAWTPGAPPEEWTGR